ncbi:MAG: hypothetical protein IKX01_04725, partial [Bacteroidales bacterium]|nr:hypothetical protein [Bacteroidales bacterium]
MLTLVIFGLSSCAIRKYVPEGKAILIENFIINDSTKYNIPKSEVNNYIIQKPNKNVFGWLPRVWVYYKTQDKIDRKFYKWINRSFGTEPVYYSAAKTENSKQQIEDYLDNIGYFKSDVEPVMSSRNNRMMVVYKIHPNKPYKVRNISYKINDTAIAKIVNELEDDFQVKEGENYNFFNIYKDRELITNHLRDNGYFMFSKDYIFYEVDTNLMQKKVDITLRIDGESHDKYLINKVFIYPDYNARTANTTVNDTVQHTFTLRKKDSEHCFDFIYGKNPKIHLK